MKSDFVLDNDVISSLVVIVLLLYLFEAEYPINSKDYLYVLLIQKEIKMIQNCLLFYLEDFVYRTIYHERIVYNPLVHELLDKNM
jgi:hypothetical protein